MAGEEDRKQRNRERQKRFRERKKAQVEQGEVGRRRNGADCPQTMPPQQGDTSYEQYRCQQNHNQAIYESLGDGDLVGTNFPETREDQELESDSPDSPDSPATSNGGTLMTEVTAGHKPSQQKKRRKLNFKCDICDRNFPYKHSIIIHMECHRGEKPYVCEKCGKALRSENNLRRHMRLHLEVKPYPCHLCDLTYADQRTLNRHLMSHTGERPYTCSECGKGFKEPAKLRRHTNLIHVKDPRFRCSICLGYYGDSSGLKVHLRTHEPIVNANGRVASHRARYLCSHCGLSLASSTCLKRHMKRFHLNVEEGPPYSCDQCDHTPFTTTSCLRRHKKSHHPAPKFNCDKCEKSFTYKWDLRRHSLVHEDPGALQCPHCSRICSTRRNLSQHKKICQVQPTAELPQTITASDECLPVGVQPIVIKPEPGAGEQSLWADHFCFPDSSHSALPPPLDVNGNIEAKCDSFMRDYYMSSSIVTECSMCIEGFDAVHKVWEHVFAHFRTGHVKLDPDI